MMRCLMCLTLFALFGAGQFVDAQGKPADKSDNKRIEQLIEKLGSRNFAVREKARAELEIIGEPALKALQKAVTSDDLETSRRAKQLVEKIENEVLAKDFLAAKTFYFNLDDVSVKTALRELEKLSGYKIEVADSDDAVMKKSISVKLGNTTFWRAFDALCAEAGLVQAKAKKRKNNGTRILPPNFPRPNIRIKPIQIPKIKIKRGKNGKIQIEKIEIKKIQIPKIQIPQNIPNAIPPQLQVQIKGKKQVQGKKPLPVQIQPIQIPIQIGGFAGQVGGTGQNNNQDIRVKPGKPASYPTCYAGSVRIRLVPASEAPQRLLPKKQDDNVIVLVFEVMGEPRLKDFGVKGEPSLTQAIDDQGQRLLLAPAPEDKQKKNKRLGGGRVMILSGPAYRNQPKNYAVLRLKRGDKNAKALKTLEGTLTVSALGKPQVLVRVVNVLKAAGKKVKGKGGDALHVQSVAKRADGSYAVSVNIERVDGNNNLPGGGIIIFNGNQIRIQGGRIQGVVIGPNGIQMRGGSNDLPYLADKNGNRLQMVSVKQQTNIRNGQRTETATMVFRPNAGQGEPHELVLTGEQRNTVSVPFAFKDVPLP